MQAEILSIGDELTCGKILDTNSQWLSLELADLGVETLYHTTVGDELEPIADVFRIAANRADLIIATGGLGPTADDLTREAVASAFGRPLRKDEALLQRIRELFERRGHVMPISNERQAFLPEGAVAIANPHGTAPGIDWTIKRQATGRLNELRILVFPGVPGEMKEMWRASGRDLVWETIDKQDNEKHVIRFRSIHCFGAGESQIEAMLPDIVNRKHFPKVGITANQGTITLRIAAEGKTEAECFKIMEPTAKLIDEKLGSLVFGEENDRLQDVVCRRLTTGKKTLAIVEAGTRGLLSEAVADSSDSNECFVGGLVVHPHRTTTAEEMIRTARKVFDADFLLLVGPYPMGAPDRQRTDEVFIALAEGRRTKDPLPLIAQEVHRFAGHPDIIDDLFVKRTLNLLRKPLI